MLKKLFILSWLGTTLLSCANRHTAYKGTYLSKELEVKSVERKGFSTNNVCYEVYYGALKPLLLDASTRDIYDRPYSRDVFAGADHYFFDTLHTDYLNDIDFERTVTPTMLYISPKTFSKEEFEAYADLFRNKWPDIVAETNKDWTYIQERYVGIVYGERENFINYFYGKEQGKPYFFDISPDGLIQYHQGKPGMETGFEGSGLASKVQMPGKIILLNDTSVFTPAHLRLYRDEKGLTMFDYFDVNTKMP